MNATFLDFDGVIADSIEETFIVSLNVFYGFSGPEKSVPIRDLFYKYRGLVGPPHHFHALHSAIEAVLKSRRKHTCSQFREVFLEKIEHCESYKDHFESLFFSLRKKLQLNTSNWIALNPITGYGKTLVGRDLENYYIITTKDKSAVDILLAAYNINIKTRYTKSDYEKYGSKGNIINHVLDCAPKYKSAIFVDDAVEHLNSVNNPLVTCYFAPWGYGANTIYESFVPEKW